MLFNLFCLHFKDNHIHLSAERYKSGKGWFLSPALPTAPQPLRITPVEPISAWFSHCHVKNHHP